MIDGVALPRYVYLDEGRRFFEIKRRKMNETAKVFNKYLELHRDAADLDVQLIPVSVTFGDVQPGKEDKASLSQSSLIKRSSKKPCSHLVWT